MGQSAWILAQTAGQRRRGHLPFLLALGPRGAVGPRGDHGLGPGGLLGVGLIRDPGAWIPPPNRPHSSARSSSIASVTSHRDDMRGSSGSVDHNSVFRDLPPGRSATDYQLNPARGSCSSMGGRLSRRIRRAVRRSGISPTRCQTAHEPAESRLRSWYSQHPRGARYNQEESAFYSRSRRRTYREDC